MGKLAGNYSIDSNKIAFFKDVYALGEIVSIKDQMVVDTDTSEKYIFVLSDGKKCFLKRIPDYAADQKAMTDRNSFVSFLLSQGFATPSIYSTKLGQSWVEYESATWILYSCESGEKFKDEANCSFYTGSFLAEFHSLSERYLKCKGKVSTASTSMLFIDLVIENVPAVKLDKGLLNKVEGLKQKCQAYRDSESFKALECIWVHGDFSPNNILYNNDKAAWLVDFDNAHVNTKIHDLAELYLTSTVFEYANNSTNFGGDIPLWDAFIKNEPLFNGYQSKVNLSKEEKKMFGDIMILVYLELVFLGTLRGDYAIDGQKVDGIISACLHIKNISEELLEG
tara:strand:+ start:59427 stop:60440 length:1014 start_codon:yes stop_codon:yes gene_type:complete